MSEVCISLGEIMRNFQNKGQASKCKYVVIIRRNILLCILFSKGNELFF